MNGSQPSHDMIPPECNAYIFLGGKLPASAIEVQAVLIFLTVINIVTFPFTAALNVLVIIAVKMKSRLRAHKSNILLASLATTDLMVGVIVQPISVALIITVVLGDTTTVSCALQNLTFIPRIVTYASLIHLALISGERYLAMKHTYAYHNGLVTEARLLIGSGLAWLFPLILNISLFFVQNRNLAAIGVTILSLCVAIIIFCQITVYCEIRRHEKKLLTQQVTEEARQKFLKDKKAFKLTAIVVSVLFLCYIPGIVYRVVVINYGNNIPISAKYACEFSVASFVMLNSLLNPLIYSVRMSQFRVAFIELIYRTANIAEAEEIERRWFGSPNAVVRIEAGKQEENQQNAERPNASTHNDILPRNENHMEQLNKNSIRKHGQRRHSIGSPNAVVRFETEQHEGDQQNVEQANVNINNENSDILPQNENHVEQMNKNSIRKHVRRRQSI